MSQEEELRQQLYEQFKNRAMIYYLIFDELRNELGAEKAEELMSRAIYRRGRQKAPKYAVFAPADLEGVQRAFLGGLADGGRAFEPELLQSGPDALDIKFHRCPLKEAWLEAGLDGDDVATLCRIAARIDNGQFESAGFTFWADTWQPGGDGCCCLHLRPGPGA
ncbi:MAG: L-2-amino-thiazoline-4-carboxylic acid hydrolase [Thermoguttaceae bacterium]|jgi:hypothetical protein|nr:L-2-amino-thiazoline-4-carboxylic acid hydrolase [Thermoguttaceae bacterium]